MSKLIFRARALDASKPMAIFYMDDVPEFQDFTSINRAVPQMPTGMEKEEECEHHLQRAISAQQAFGHTGELVIPTPEVYNVSKNVKDELYPSTYKHTRQLIHVQPFSMEQETPDYDMDSDDERWLSEQPLSITPLKFEEMMDRLEKCSGQQVLTLREAQLLLKGDNEIITTIYDYWLNKRLRTQHSLIPQVRSEKRDGTTNNNPYVAFRRRMEKMQTRKNRKNDETSFEKMLKIRRDFSAASNILQLVSKRETTKRDLQQLKMDIIRKRFSSRDFSGQILAEVAAMIRHPRQSFLAVNSNQIVIKQEPRVPKSKPPRSAQSKKRTYKRKRGESGLAKITHGLTDVPSSEEDVLSVSQSDHDEDVDPDGPFAFKRKKNCSYHEPRLDSVGSWPWCSSEEGGTEDKRFRFCLTSVPRPPDYRLSCVGYVRKRIGRGGRVVLDRLCSPLDDCLSKVDDYFSMPKSSPPSSSDPFWDELKDCTHFRPKTSTDATSSRPRPRDSGDFSRNNHPGEDNLFELQRKQLERLKNSGTQPYFLSDYTTLPSSFFRVSNVPTPLHHYHLVSAELAESATVLRGAATAAPAEARSINLAVATHVDSRSTNVPAPSDPRSINLVTAVLTDPRSSTLATTAPTDPRSINLATAVLTDSRTSILATAASTDPRGANPAAAIVRTCSVEPRSSAQYVVAEIRSSSVEPKCLVPEEMVFTDVSGGGGACGSASISTPNIERVVALTNGPHVESGDELSRHSELLRRFASVVPSIEREEALRVVHAKARLPTQEHNGNDTRLKFELFLNKVKVEKVPTEGGVSMDVT